MFRKKILRLPFHFEGMTKEVHREQGKSQLDIFPLRPRTVET